MDKHELAEKSGIPLSYIDTVIQSGRVSHVSTGSTEFVSIPELLSAYQKDHPGTPIPELSQLLTDSDGDGQDLYSVN